MATARITLSEAQEYDIRGTIIKVYPLSGEQIIKLMPQVQDLEKMQNSKDTQKIVEACINLVYEIIHQDNEAITKDMLFKILSLSGAMTIVNKAMGI